MRQAPSLLGHVDFQRMLLEEFPEMREEIGYDEGLLHLEMAAFARHTQQAIDEGDWPRLKRCVHLAHQLWQRADPPLKNALNVSYLEHLEFTGAHGPQAWSRFTRELQQGWKEMQAYWEQLAKATKRKG